ncbi:MAG: IclR family transcriptional regulator, partial [Anaerolineae bacterium]
TGLSKSTVFRFTYTLEDLGFLERDPETKQYRPGLKVLRLGFTALNSLEMGQIAQPYLKALSAECGWTSNMTVRDEAEIVYVARNKTQQILSVDLHLGSRLPVYCTSMGKAQLIDLSRQELHVLIGEGPYERRGPNTITRLEDLVAELDQVRRLGYAVADEELAPGLRAVAAPVRGHTELVVAAVNVSVPGGRVSREELESRLAPMVVETARQISGALGATVER